MYAIIETGGKQYRVEEGDLIAVERLAGEAGEKVAFDQVLFVGGDQPQVGTPVVTGASVSGTIVSQTRGDKIIVFKFKRRKMYRRKNGHRQALTNIRIEEIGFPGAKPKKEAKPVRAEATEASEKAAEPVKSEPKAKPQAAKPQKAKAAKAKTKSAKEKPKPKPAAKAKTEKPAAKTAKGDAKAAKEAPKKSKPAKPAKPSKKKDQE